MNQHTSGTYGAIVRYLRRRPKGRTAREIAHGAGLGYVAVDSCLRNNEVAVTVLHKPRTYGTGFFRDGTKACTVTGRTATVWCLD